MPKYIDLERLNQVLDEDGWLISGAHDVENILKDIPTVDAEPVRHGHWIPDYGNLYECSACKCLWYTLQDNNMRFCPECGAHMDEEVKLDAAIH